VAVEQVLISSINDVAVLETHGLPLVQASIYGTYGGINLAFEFSNDLGAHWYTLQAVRTDDRTIEAATGSLSNVQRAWWIKSLGATHVRMRPTAFGSGPATVILRTSAEAIDPNPSVTASFSGTITLGTVNQGTAGADPWLVKVSSDAASSWKRIAGAAPTSATQLASHAANRSVFIKADDGNSGTIYLGDDNTVTANSGASTSGIPLKAGQAVTLKVANTNLIWMIASAAGQNYSGAVV
jgi:hypothetical protein